MVWKESLLFSLYKTNSCLGLHQPQRRRGDAEAGCLVCQGCITFPVQAMKVRQALEAGRDSRPEAIPDSIPWQNPAKTRQSRPWKKSLKRKPRVQLIQVKIKKDSDTFSGEQSVSHAAAFLLYLQGRWSSGGGHPHMMVSVGTGPPPGSDSASWTPMCAAAEAGFLLSASTSRDDSVQDYYL